MVAEEQQSFFRENGFIQIPRVVSAEELDALRRGVDEVLREREKAPGPKGDAEYERIFTQMVNVWRVNPLVKQHVLSPRLAGIARQLLGVEHVRLWHDHALIKMPRDSRESAWHQDHPYWPHNQAASVSCWLAMDDVDETNGCMSFIPGSHRWGRLEPVRLTDPQDLNSIVPDADSRDFTAVPQPMPAGSCTFHHSLTFHYAGPNTTDRPRRAMVTIYMADGTTWDGSPHVVTDPLGLEPGQALEGDLFPVVA